MSDEKTWFKLNKPAEPYAEIERLHAEVEAAKHEAEGISDQLNQVVDRLQKTEAERDLFRSEIERLETACERISDAANARAEAAERERDAARSTINDLHERQMKLVADRDATEAKATELAKEVAEWRSRPDALRADKAEAKVAKLREALEIFQRYGCPACNGDCSAANPPVMLCPTRMANDALKETEQ